MKPKIIKIIALIAALIMTAGLFTACNNNQDFYSNASFFKVNTKEETCLSFHLTMFSKKKIKVVEFLGAEGTGFEQGELTVNIIDSTIDEISNKKFKGFYAKTLLIEIMPNAELETITISAMLFNVDNENRKVSFSNNIKHEFSKGINFSEILEIRFIPVEFSSAAIGNGSSFGYDFVAMENITLQDIYCLDFVNVRIVEIRIDDIAVENAALPFDVQEEQKVSIILIYETESLTEFDYAMTNLYFSFNTEQDSELRNNAFIIIFDPIYPIMNNDTSHIRNFIEKLIAEK